MTFWIAAVVLALMVLGVIALSFLRAGAGSEDEAAAAHDMQVYRDQLHEVERDHARGIIGDAEAERLRTEVARRLLAADRSARSGGTAAEAPRPTPRAAVWTGVGVSAAAVGVAFWAYLSLGAPGYPDMPLADRIAAAEERHANRPSQEEVEAEATAARETEATLQDSAPQADPDPEHEELVEQLRTALGNRPDDLQGHELLARNEAALGNFDAAHRAQARVIELKGDDATAEDYADLADLKIMAAGGYVSPQAESALEGALRRDQGNQRARYYVGLMYAQNDRPDRAFRIWRVLLEQSEPNAPWVQPLRQELPRLAQMAGERYELPPEGQRPAEAEMADMDAIEEMSPEERVEMIEGMVEGLSQRLASEGGDAGDWAQLITAYGELGELDQAGAIWNEAQQVFEASPDDLEMIRQAAVQAGVIE